MRILLITRYFPPLESIATNRMHAWAKYWALEGHDVTVCTTHKGGRGSVSFPVRLLEVPYFDPISFVSGDQLKRQATSDKGFRSKFAHIAMSWYRKRLNERLPSRTAFWPRQAKKRLQGEEGFDLIVSSYGPPTAHMIGLWAKKRFGCPWFADFRDLWVNNHNYLGVWPWTLWEQHLEKKVIEQSDCAITVSKGLQQVLLKQYPQADVRIIPNGFDPDDLCGLTRLKIGQKFSLIYTGTLYDKKQDPEPLFQALAKMVQNDPSFAERFELLFFGSATQNLPKLIEKYQLSKLVQYRGLVSRREALQAQVDADALLLLNFDHSYDGLLTGKVFEYLAADKPILAIGVQPKTELGQLIETVGGGVLCPNQSDEIRKTTIALMRGQISHQSDRKALELYSRKHQAELITSWALKCSQRTISSSE